MTISSGNLDSLLGTTLPLADIAGVTVESFTTSGTVPVIATATVETTGGPASIGINVDSITIGAVDDATDSLTLVLTADGITTDLPVYVLAFSADGLLISANTSEVIAGLLALGNNVDDDLALISATPAAASTTVALSATGTYTAALPVPCFALGTRISTPRGEVAVEDLVEGDMIKTHFTGEAVVQWIGRSTIDCRRHARPALVTPVRVRAGAFGPAVPVRDVLLSPGHAVFADGVLIPVCHLVNGITVVHEADAGIVTYFHVEVASHDVLMADGLPAETYLDDGNRTAFANGAAHRLLQPDHVTRNWSEACAPKREGGPELADLRHRLRQRALDLGYRLAEPGFALWAGQTVMEPRFARGGLRHYLLPAGVEEVRLRSPSGTPATVFDGSQDTRRLGARLALVLLDGEMVALDSPALADGFHGIERTSHGSWRWTDGNGVLRLPPAVQPRLLEVLVTNVMPRWDMLPERSAIAA